MPLVTGITVRSRGDPTLCRLRTDTGSRYPPRRGGTRQKGLSWSLMALALHVQNPWTTRPQVTRIGDAVTELGKRYAAEMNASAFATALRERHIPRRSYIAFIATMYPIVVGFNRALIRSIAKVDHVRHSSFVKMLAQQLDEEQSHNQLWRAMLEVFDVDHEALYNDFQEYLERIPLEELDRRCNDV